MNKVTLIQSPPTIDPPVDVLTRRRLFYFQEDFSLTNPSPTNDTDPVHTYDEYLANMVALLDHDLESFPEVFLAPFHIEDFTHWALTNDEDPTSAAARKAYLAAFEQETMISLTDPSVVYAIATTDYMSQLALSAIHYRLEDADEEDHVDALADLMDDGEHVTAHFSDFLGSAMSSSAIITYHVEINPDGRVGNAVKLSGDLCVHLCGDHIHADTPEHFTMLNTAFALSQLSPASFFVRAFEDETNPRTGHPLKTLYGFYVDREGIKGLSSAQLFDACCTDEDGGPIPPEEGAVYADAPDIDFN